MTKIEYLEKHHHITCTTLGLISVSETMEEVKAHLARANKKLDEIHIQRLKALSSEGNWGECVLEKVHDLFGYPSPLDCVGIDGAKISLGTHFHCGAGGVRP